MKIHGDASFAALTCHYQVPTTRQPVEPTTGTAAGLLMDLASYQRGRDSTRSSSGMQPANAGATLGSAQAAAGETPATSLSSRALSLNVPAQHAERAALFSMAGYDVGAKTLDSGFHRANLAAFKLQPQLSRGDFVWLGGRQFVTAPLSRIRFCRRIIGFAGSQPPKFAISELPQNDPTFTRRVLEDDSMANQAEAVARLRNIGLLMLRHYPDTLAVLQKQYRQREEECEERYPVSTAVEHYRANGGDHLLMNAIACGHATLPEFLESVFPNEFSAHRAVATWIYHFLVKFGDDELYQPHEVVGRFANELQVETRELDDFLCMGSSVANFCVLKGIKHFGDHEVFPMSTCVNGFDYVRAFLSGQPIMYDGFLSTTYEPIEAVEFTNNVILGDPRYVIDFSDPSGRSEVLRRHALADLASNVHRQVSSIVLAIRARSARASVLDEPIFDDTPDDKEVLFATGHVLLPVMAVRCEGGYVLFADAYHRDFVQ